jgi:hypothetical protein
MASRAVRVAPTTLLAASKTPRIVEQLELGPGRAARLEPQHAALKSLFPQLAQKDIVPVWTEGMTLAEAVARNLLAGNQADLLAHGAERSTASARTRPRGSAATMVFAALLEDNARPLQ